MATDDQIRASDSDREVVVATLREAYTAGRLTLDEFDERTTAAYTSRTWGDLRPLTADLPVQPILGGDIPGHSPPSRSAGPRLTPAPPLGQPPLPLGRRRRPIAILIPVAVWTLIALNGGAAHGIAALLATVILVAVFVAALRRR